MFLRNCTYHFQKVHMKKESITWTYIDIEIQQNVDNNK